MIFVPKEAEIEIIERYHDDIREGHPGETRTSKGTTTFRECLNSLGKRRSTSWTCVIRTKYLTRNQLGKCKATKTSRNNHGKLTAEFLEMPPTKHPFLPGLLDELLVVVDTFSKQIVLIQIEITSVAQRHQEFNR